MKYLKLIFLFLGLYMTDMAHSQARWWGGYTVNEVVDKSELIFEGRILNDSAFMLNPPGNIFTVHRVLVLKQFKGDFKSDIINVVTWGGRVMYKGQEEGNPGAYAFKGDEAVFLATNSSKVEFGGNDTNTFDVFYGPGVSYVTVCDKKDVGKEVYEPIEAVTGQPYVEVHPNNCKGQQAPQK